MHDAYSVVRIITLPYNRGTIKGHFIEHSSSDVKLLEGKLTYSGDKLTYYDGQFAKHYGQSVRYGKGTELSYDGSKYTGEWSRDKKHGFGQLDKPNGDVYIGDFKEDLYNRFGEYRYSDGSIYKGDWVSNKHHGFGEIKYVDGRVETGFFDQGKFTKDEPPLPASVPIDLKDKKKVNGRFKWGKGKGSIDDSGKVYNGELRNFNMHGKGTLK